MGKDKKRSSDAEPDFETNIKSLEAIIEKLEDSDTGLQGALSDFEKGINLTRSAQKALAEAEQKVSLLLDDDNGPAEEAFLLKGGEE